MEVATVKPEISEPVTKSAVHVADPQTEIGSVVKRMREVEVEAHAPQDLYTVNPSSQDITEKLPAANLHHPRKFASIITLIIMVAIISTFFVTNNFASWFGQKAGAEKAGGKVGDAVVSPVVTVTTSVASANSISDEMVVTGSVSAWDPLNVGAEVSGLRIETVRVEEGDKVSKGQVLATLNSALLRAQLEQVRARLSSTEASLKKSIQPNRPEDILSLEAAVAQAEANVSQEEAMRVQASANLANANLNARRFQELAKAGAVSDVDAENKQLAAANYEEQVHNFEHKVRAAKFLVDQAKQRLVLAHKGGRVEDVDISRALIAETRAQAAHLERQIEQTVIRSPDHGVISKRDAHIGNITSSGTPLFSIIRLNKLELRAQVSDLDLHKFKVGQVVAISTREGDKSEVSGKVWLVSPQVDQSSRLGTVRIELPTNAGLKPGMFVRGQVNLGEREAITVPVQSLVTRNGESIIFKLGTGNHAESTVVETGASSDTWVEIKSGLKTGDVVIARGARFLSDNDVVQVGQ